MGFAVSPVTMAGLTINAEPFEAKLGRDTKRFTICLAARTFREPLIPPWLGLGFH